MSAWVSASTRTGEMSANEVAAEPFTHVPAQLPQVLVCERRPRLRGPNAHHPTWTGQRAGRDNDSIARVGTDLVQFLGRDDEAALGHDGFERSTGCHAPKARRTPSEGRTKSDLERSAFHPSRPVVHRCLRRSDGLAGVGDRAASAVPSMEDVEVAQ
jgi:hypothetical protein